jgi:hypothetical protein
MKVVLSLALSFCSIFLISCKKDPVDNSGLSNPESLDHSVSYKIIATIPSPADIDKGLFRDSLNVILRTKKGDSKFLSNIDNVSSNIDENSFGFSFGYHDPNKSYPYFLLTSYAFPAVPREFQLNHTYEHTTTRGTLKPMFLGTPDGVSGMTYFINNVYPPDAGSPTSKTFTSVRFTKKLKVGGDREIILLGSGHISGYCINYWHLTDTTKYVQRWDFTVDFTDLRINP